MNINHLAIPHFHSKWNLTRMLTADTRIPEQVLTELFSRIMDCIEKSQSLISDKSVSDRTWRDV